MWSFKKENLHFDNPQDIDMSSEIYEENANLVLILYSIS